ncbi:MAG: hypothetical protein KDK62_03850 [Chlamydiia bacterium]|nr:hypothetical protein [Chlamydiia bacterium]
MEPATSTILSLASSHSVSPSETPRSPSEFTVPPLGILNEGAMHVLLRRLSPRSSMEQCMDILKEHNADVLLETADMMKPPNPMFRAIALAAVMQKGVLTPRLKRYLEAHPRTLVDLDQLWIQDKPFDPDLIDKSSYLFFEEKRRPYALKSLNFGGVDTPGLAHPIFLKLGLYLVQKGPDKAFLFGDFITQLVKNEGKATPIASFGIVVSRSLMNDPDFLNLLKDYGEPLKKTPNPTPFYDQTLEFQGITLHVQKEGAPPPTDNTALMQSILETLPYSSRALLSWLHPQGWTFWATKGVFNSLLQ